MSVARISLIFAAVLLVAVCTAYGALVLGVAP
jgi:hypothetical protein